MGETNILHYLDTKNDRHQYNKSKLEKKGLTVIPIHSIEQIKGISKINLLLNIHGFELLLKAIQNNEIGVDNVQYIWLHSCQGGKLYQYIIEENLSLDTILPSKNLSCEFVQKQLQLLKQMLFCIQS